MRRRTPSFLLAFAAVASFACTGEVAVVAQLENPDGGDPTPLADLEVRFLPYDRDAIFDSLTATAGSPEPSAPDSLVLLQQQIAEAQTAWSNAEERWNAARDSLRKIQEATDRMARAGQRATGQYRLLVSDFADQEARERTANRDRESAFARYTGLQSRYANAVQEFRIRRDNWGDEAYADVEVVRAARLAALGKEEVWDTTNANGFVQRALPKGQWWVHARYELPYEELYWNGSVEVAGGDPVQVILNRSTALVRPRY
jgi:hypothetical protein